MSFVGRLVCQVAFSALLLLSCSVTPLLAQHGDAKGGGAKNTKRDYSLWNGLWDLVCEYESAEKVVVTINLSENKENAFLAWFTYGDGVCDCGIDAPNPRSAFLSTHLTDLHLDGNIWFCTTAKALADAKNLTAVFMSHFEGDFDPHTATIIGQAKTEFYTSSDGKPEHYARDPAKDRFIMVILKPSNIVPSPDPPPADPNPTPTADPRDGIKNTSRSLMDRLIAGDRNMSKSKILNPPTPPPQPH